MTGRDAQEPEDRAPETGPRPVARVRKRGGRVVTFDPARIEAAVLAAQSAVGEDDPQFAREVAEVVSLALAARLGGRPRETGELIPPVPDIEAIQDLVERALIEMGRAAVAKAYILYRDRRARTREAIRVDVTPREGRGPLVDEREGTSEWQRNRIVAALVGEADLPRAASEEVAARVEHRVFDSGLRRLSTALIRELVDNELLAMGLDGALSRQKPVSLPRHDLRRLFESAAPAPPDARRDYTGQRAELSESVAGELLSRFALEDVFGESLAERHKSGDLFIEDASRPHEVLARAIPTELLLRRELSSHTPFELLAELAPIARETAFGIVLEDVHRILAPLGKGARADGVLRDFLRGVGALGCAAGVRIDFGPPGGRGAVATARLLPEIAALEAEDAPVPGLFVSYEELETALLEEPTAAAAAETLAATGHLVPVWHGAEERWVGPGCRRRPKEGVALACAGAVALNLPRLARRAGPWREELLFTELTEAVAEALDGLARLDRFQREVRAARGELLRERRSFAVTPVGLEEALRILGDGELRPEQGARLLGLFSEAVRRFSAERGLTVVLSPFFGARARVRFARRDAGRPRPAQPRLFDELPAPEDVPDAAYSSGYELPHAFGIDPGAAEAHLLTTVPSGALYPSPLAGDRMRLADERTDRPALRAWQRFHNDRRPGAAERPARVKGSAPAGSLFAGPR